MSILPRTCLLVAIMVISAGTATATNFEFTQDRHLVIEGEQTVRVVIERDDSTTFGTIDLLVKDGTAVSGQEYGDVDGAVATDEAGIYRVQFDAGQARANVDIDVLSNSFTANKFFSVALRPPQSDYPSESRLGAKRTAVVQIGDVPGGVAAPAVLQLGVSSVNAPSFSEQRNKVIVRGTSGDDTFNFNPVGWSTVVLSTDVDVPEAIRPCYCLCDQSVEFDGLGGNDRLTLEDEDPDSVATATVTPGSFSYVSAVTRYEWYSTSTSTFPFNATTFVYRFHGKNLESIDLNTCLGGSFGDSGDSQRRPFSVDKVFLLDSDGNDDLVIGPEASAMIGSNFLNRVSGFDSVVAYSTSGTDRAFFNDSPGDDVFVGKQHFSRLTGERDNPKQPDDVNSYSYATGEPVSRGESRYLQAVIPFDCYAAGFAKTYATATTGFDVAHLYDSPDDDQYFGNAVYGLLEGPDLFQRVTRFDSIGVYSSLGSDTARLAGSNRDDYFVSKRTTTALFAADRRFAHTLKRFSIVGARGNGGNDEAQFYDSETPTSLTADPGGVETTGGGFVSRAVEFEKVLAVSTHEAENRLIQFPGLPYFFGRVGEW